MKRLFLFIIAWLLMLAPALAQNSVFARQVLSADGGAQLIVTGMGTGTITVSGSFSGTIFFEVVGGPGTAAVSVDCFAPDNPGAAVNSTTAAGTWVCPVGGMSVLQARMNTLVSGSATVDLVATPGGGASGGGTVGSGASIIELTNADAEATVFVDSNGDPVAPASGNTGAPDANTTRTVPASLPLPFRSLDLDESEEEADDDAGEVCGVWFTNTATATRWLKFYNADADDVTVGTTAPVITIGLPGNTSDDISGSFQVNGGCVQFSTAITVAVTTGVADNDTGAPGAGDVQVVIFRR